MIQNSLDFRQLRSANHLRAEEGKTGTETIVPLSFSMNELSGEVGELANIIKKVERQELGLRGGREFTEVAGDIADEMADVVVCVDLLARKLGIDLSTAIRDKFNKTSDKHGFETKL